MSEDVVALNDGGKPLSRAFSSVNFAAEVGAQVVDSISDPACFKPRIGMREAAWFAGVLYQNKNLEESPKP